MATFDDPEGDRRRMRLAYQALGEILAIGEEQDLPAIRWSIGEWSVVGECTQIGEGEADARRAAFVSWTRALGLRGRAEEKGVDGLVELRASASDYVHGRRRCGAVGRRVPGRAGVRGRRGCLCCGARRPDGRCAMTTPEPMLMPAKAARVLGMDKRTLIRRAEAGLLRTEFTPGGHRRFYASEVHALAELPSKVDGWDFSPANRLTVREVAALFAVEDRTVCRWRSDGRLVSVRTPSGRHWFSREQVEAILRGQNGGA